MSAATENPAPVKRRRPDNSTNALPPSRNSALNVCGGLLTIGPLIKYSCAVNRGEAEPVGSGLAATLASGFCSSVRQPAVMSALWSAFRSPFSRATSPLTPPPLVGTPIKKTIRISVPAAESWSALIRARFSSTNFCSAFSLLQLHPS